MTVELTVNELYQKVKFLESRDCELDYFCGTIGALAYSRLRRKSFHSVFTEINFCHAVNVLDSVNLCHRMLFGAGASQKYLAGYRRLISSYMGGIRISPNGEASGFRDTNARPSIDDLPDTPSYRRTAQNFYNRIFKLGAPEANEFEHSPFRIGILKQNIALGHGDDVIRMSYDLTRI